MQRVLSNCVGLGAHALRARARWRAGGRELITQQVSRRPIKGGGAALHFLHPASQGVFQGSRGFRGRACGGSDARRVNRPVSADAPGDVWSTAAAASEVEAAIFLRHKSRAPPWLVASERPPRWCTHDSGSVRPVATKVRATSLDTPLTSPMCSAPLRSRPHLMHRQYVVKRQRRCSSTLTNAAAASRRCRSPSNCRSRAQFR